MVDAVEYRPGVTRRVSEHDIRGIRYAVSEWGDRDSPLIFLLHGWGDCSATFQFVVDAFKRDWFVVAPDWRGFGDSGWNASSYWFPDYIPECRDRNDPGRGPHAAIRRARSARPGYRGLPYKTLVNIYSTV